MTALLNLFVAGTFEQQCAIFGCKNACGNATKCIKTLKGVYEINDQFVHLKHSEIENLKVCNVHYNKDQRRHQKLLGTIICLEDQTCLACSKTVKTTKSLPCKQHSINISNNGSLINSAMSYCFFSEYSTQNSKIIDNEHLYSSSDSQSQTSF